MSAVNWKKLANQIPHKVQLSKRLSYEVSYARFDRPELLGESRPATKQIIIREGMGAKETVITYIHELLHSISDVGEVKLTENQIQALEKFFYYALKPGNVFMEDNKDG